MSVPIKQMLDVASRRVKLISKESTYIFIALSESRVSVPPTLTGSCVSFPGRGEDYAWDP